jgi:hypothetical protein
MDNDEVISTTMVKADKDISGPTYDHTMLKAAHKAGAVIQFNDPDYGWVNLRSPLWKPECEYRIQPDLETLLKENEEFK